MKRLANVYIKLHNAGCVLFKTWSAEFICDSTTPVCALLVFGEGVETLKVLYILFVYCFCSCNFSSTRSFLGNKSEQKLLKHAVYHLAKTLGNIMNNRFIITDDVCLDFLRQNYVYIE